MRRRLACAPLSPAPSKITGPPALQCIAASQQQGQPLGPSDSQSLASKPLAATTTQPIRPTALHRSLPTMSHNAARRCARSKHQEALDGSELAVFGRCEERPVKRLRGSSTADSARVSDHIRLHLAARSQSRCGRPGTPCKGASLAGDRQRRPVPPSARPRLRTGPGPQVAVHRDTTSSPCAPAVCPTRALPWRSIAVDCCFWHSGGVMWHWYCPSQSKQGFQAAR